MVSPELMALSADIPLSPVQSAEMRSCCSLRHHIHSLCSTFKICRQQSGFHISIVPPVLKVLFRGGHGPLCANGLRRSCHLAGAAAGRAPIPCEGNDSTLKFVLVNGRIWRSTLRAVMLQLRHASHCSSRRGTAALRSAWSRHATDLLHSLRSFRMCRSLEAVETISQNENLFLARGNLSQQAQHEQSESVGAGSSAD